MGLALAYNPAQYSNQAVMRGHLPQAGLFGGFQSVDHQTIPVNPGPSGSIMARFASPEGVDTEAYGQLMAVRRGDITMPPDQLTNLVSQLMEQSLNFQRTITSSMTAFPVRENLEAEAKVLVPVDTPVRNRLRRTPGSGKSSAWKQLSNFGGGFGLQTVLTAGASSATQTVADTSGFRAGDIVWFGINAAARTISSITSSTILVLTATIDTTIASGSTQTLTNTTYPPGAGANANSQTRAFFAETGAPAARSSVYVDKSATYKLLGTYYDVTGFAMAAGANFQNQYQVEQANAIKNLMLNEEFALLYGDSTQTTPPFGDGTTALAFDGLNTLIATANGTPTAQIQTSVGALTTAHIDAQLKRLWEQGAVDVFMIMSGTEALSLNHLAEAAGSIIRVNQTADGIVLGRKVIGYLHPITGQMVDILVSRFQKPGTILYVAEFLPQGGPVVDVDVLPQVQLPQLAPTENIQGYTAQVLAPTTSAPQVYPGIVTVYQTVRLKSALHVAKSSGLLPV